jgi:uncharacterized repeat protein (TIGR01451 family)
MSTFRRSFVRLLTLAAMLALALPALGAAVPLPGDAFEADDGNIAATVLDWANASPLVFVDTPSASDSSFTVGAQEDVPNQTWTIVNQPVANKADIERLYVAADYPFLRLGIVRNQQASGTGSYNIELNQSTAKHANGLPIRTAGDALIIFDFQGNNPTATLTMHRWVTAGANTQCSGNTVVPCWGPPTTLNASQAVGANNATSILDTVTTPTAALGARTFDELAVNLQAALNLPQGQCIDFGQTWLRTRAGGAFGSALIDLMGPVAINVGNCDVAIEKDVVAVDGANALNPASVPLTSTLDYRVRVFLGPDSTPVSRTALTVTDTTLSDASLTNAPLAPVVNGGTVVGDTNANDLLELGESWLYALDGTGTPVAQTATACADVVNTVKVVVAGDDTNPANNRATRSTGVICTPDLAIDKIGPASIAYGQTITYTVNVSNIGDPVAIPRADVHVTDPAIVAGDLTFSSEISGDGDTLFEKGEVWQYGLIGGGAITRPANVCGPIDNLAAVAALTGETALGNNSDTVTTTITCVPDIAVTKTAPASVAFGATIPYTVTVTSVGDPLPIPRVDIQVTDPAVAGATALVFFQETAGDGDTLLEPGDMWEYRLAGGGALVLPASSCAAVGNTAVVAALDGETVTTNNQSSTTTSVTCVPDVAIQKSGPATVQFGDTITYGVAVTSVGDPLPIAKADLVVTDPMVSGTPLSFFAEIQGNGDEFLDPGEQWVYRLGTAPITLPANVCGPLTNTAVVALVGDGNAANDQSSVTTTVLCTLNIGIAKTSDKTTYAAGEPIVYTVTVTNSGQSAIPFSAIQISDPSLPGLTLVGQAPAELAPGAQLTYTGTRSTSPADCGTVPNTATVTLLLDAVETTLTDNTASHNVTVTCTLDLAVAKSADKPSYTPGETISYTVTVSNIGQLPIPFADIAISDPTLPNLTLVGAAPSVLSPGASVSFTGTRPVTAANCGNVVNTATVSLTRAPQPETLTTNNSASVTVAVAGGSCNPIITGDAATALTITKVGPKASQVRRAVRYKLRVTNVGSAVARNVIVRDPVPTGMTVAKLPPNATLSKGQLRWSIGDLQPGQSVIVEVFLRAERNVSRRICNVGFASASNAPEVKGTACTRFLKIGGVVRIPVVTG